MLITFLSRGRGATEVARSLQRLEHRLSGADDDLPVLSSLPGIQFHAGRPPDDRVAFAALHVRDVAHPAVLEASTLVVVVCEGEHADRQGLVAAAAAANREGKARVLVLGTGVHHAEVAALPLRLFPLSPDVATCRILYAALLREAATIETGSLASDRETRRIVALRMLRLSEGSSVSRFAPSGRTSSGLRYGGGLGWASISAPGSTRGGVR